MKTNYSGFLALCTSLFISIAAPAAEPEAAPSSERIGVYDSRAVAVAFAGSDAQKKWMAPLVAEHRKAKEAGDLKRVKELEAEGAARQHKAHSQGFGTAPVDDLLEHIKDQLPAIKEKAGVSVLVSKWDKPALEKHRTAARVDVTMALVDAFNPGAKQRQTAIDIQKREPVAFGREAAKQ